MLFSAEDWRGVLDVLIDKTASNKIKWSKLSSATQGSLSAAIRNMSNSGDYEASIGSSSFVLGASDGDGRAPYYLKISRRDQSGVVSDMIRTGITLADTPYGFAREMIENLYREVRMQDLDKASAVKSILSDLEEL